MEQAEEFATRAVALDDQKSLRRIGRWASVNLHLRRHDVALREAERSISPRPKSCGRARSPRQCAALFGQVRGGAYVFRSGNGPEPLLSGPVAALPGTSDVPVGPVRGCRRSLKRRLVRNPGTDVSRVLLAASYGHLGRFDEAREEWQEVFRSIPIILWNTVAKCCPTRTLPISSGWWTGFARPVWYNDI